MSRRDEAEARVDEALSLVDCPRCAEVTAKGRFCEHCGARIEGSVYRQERMEATATAEADGDAVDFLERPMGERLQGMLGFDDDGEAEDEW